MRATRSSLGHGYRRRSRERDRGRRIAKLDFQSVNEARKLGRALGMEIVQVATNMDSMQPAGALKRASWDLHFPKGRYDDDPAHGLCEAPELGMSAAGGAR